ncbi:hypothetical protein JHK82_041643 [Glycine max]|nr:hypothetical protein JHK82_041643 [Glycine max]
MCGPLYLLTSKRKASFVNNLIPSTTSSSRPSCKKSSTILRTLKFDPRISTIPLTNPIPLRYLLHFNFYSAPSAAYKFRFGKIYLSEPMMTESDGKTARMYPMPARLGNVNVYKAVIKKGHDGEVFTETKDLPKIFIGKVPIMLGSSYFSSSKNSESGFNKIRECPFDQGGYFIINGSEKVLIAQDRRGRALIMSMCSRRTNLASKPRWLKFVRMLSRTSSRGGSSGQYICATLPYIRTEIPIVIVFRALGIVPDKHILEHISYDFSDTQMVELLRPSLGEAFVIQNQQVALDYIGKRGATVGVTKENRIKYIIHRLLLCALGRRAEDDRDHYGNKRRELAGPLVGGLFRTEISPAVIPQATKVFVNGCWMGIHRDPDKLVTTLRELRRRLSIISLMIPIPPPLDIEYPEEGGWYALMSKGLIEYIDTEEETTMISMTISDLVQARINPEEAFSDTYTHCEIHPSLILGVCASNIPFPDHNQDTLPMFYVIHKSH